MGGGTVDQAERTAGAQTHVTTHQVWRRPWGSRSRLTRGERGQNTTQIVRDPGSSPGSAAYDSSDCNPNPYEKLSHAV